MPRRDDRDHLEGQKIGTVEIIEYVGFYKNDSVYVGRCENKKYHEEPTIEHYTRQKLKRNRRKSSVMCSKCMKFAKHEIHRTAYYEAKEKRQQLVR